MNLQTLQVAPVFVLAMAIASCVRAVFFEDTVEPNVAIFADYDGCWDVYRNHEAQDMRLVHARGFLTYALAGITRGRKVTLFVASNRQCGSLDAYNSQRNKNGLALGKDGAFERWAKEYKWTLNKALLSDDAETPFSAWDNPNASNPWNSEGGETDQDLKVRIVRNNFKYLKDTGYVHVFYFDDKSAYLDYVRKHVRVEIENTNIEFYTVHYDKADYGNKITTTDLVAQNVYGTKKTICLEWPDCSIVA